MTRILITDGIEKSAVDNLVKDGFEVIEKFYELEELKNEVKDFDVLVVRSATKVRQSIIDVACETGKLRLIIRGGVGIDNIDAEYAESKGITVRNTPNASSVSVAELVMAHMLSLARFVHISNHTMRLGKWNKKNYEGMELSGKTLGLIGYGRIAREVAKRAQVFGMNIIYNDILGEMEGVGFEYNSLEDVLKKSDFISLHIPGSKDKKPIIGEKEIEIMKDGVYIINTARGEVISEEALLNALNIGKVAGAALDVFQEEPTKNKELYTHDKVSLSPHIGASTKEAQEKIGGEVVSIINGFFKKGDS